VQPRKKRKCIKRKIEDLSLVLGKDIDLNDVLSMEKEVVMGNFSSRRMYMVVFWWWMEQIFQPILGYTTKFLILS